MRIDFHGRLVDEPTARVGFIGCGSHSFRNLYPCLQFCPVELVATCDLDVERARAFARRFGAERAYADHREMLAKEKLDGVLICTGYDKASRPTYPQLAIDCMEAGCDAWIEKPPAHSSAEIERMQQAAEQTGKHVMVGLKKMFFPANEKAAELMRSAEFGPVSYVSLQYPQYVPTVDELAAYGRGEGGPAVGFLDHLCHPVALMVFLLGMPRTLFYERSDAGAGVAVFRFGCGTVAALQLTHGASSEGGMERTMIVSPGGRHVVVDNNVRVSYHRGPEVPKGQGYGSTPSHFTGPAERTTAVWEPEFSLGQLYNKGLFLLGYWGEINEFARAMLEGRPPAKGTLEQAWQVTRIFEAFAEGPGRTIEL